MELLEWAAPQPEPAAAVCPRRPEVDAEAGIFVTGSVIELGRGNVEV